MLPVYYDLHIHSALSPCAASDMTPNDIVGMALLNGLDLIAITDHNSMSNAAAVIEAANNINKQQEKNIIVLPGVEVSTVEEVHILCLFDCIEAALEFDRKLYPFLPDLNNRIDIFGNQVLYDENDNVIGEEQRMLIAPTTISFDALYELTHACNGAFIPAHIDRSSFSVISNLGFIPPHLNINTVEVSPNGIENEFLKQNTDITKQRKIISSSDAHQLWAINERINSISLPELSAKAAIDFLR